MVDSAGPAFSQNDARPELTWVKPAPGANLVQLKKEIGSRGGKVLTFAPEGQLLVRSRRDKVATLRGLAGVAGTRAAAFAKERQGPTGRGLGERPPSAAEKKMLAGHIVRLDRVEPNTLSRDRAILDGSDTLPTLVDNSLSMYFPPIRSQGAQGSCVAWATGYYYNTYTQAKDENLDVSGGDNDHICSPAFVYNLINDGVDDGAVLEVGMYVLDAEGCSNWTLQPYNQADWTTWPTEEAWVDALQRRTDTAFEVGSWSSGCTDTDIAAIKQHLANGNIAATRTDVYTNWYNNSTLADTTGVNNGVLFANSGTNVGGHGMTIVGYDDNRSYFDGSTTKYGAFLIANSWGASWGRTNTGGTTLGFMWVAYDFFKAANSCFGGACFNSDRSHYRPRLYAVSGLNHTQRGYVRHQGGVGSPFASPWTNSYPIYYFGGTSLAIDDTKRVAVDLTDGIGFIEPPNVELFTELNLSSSATGNGTITSADFYCDLDGDGSYDIISSTDPTVTVSPGSSGYATVGFEWCPEELDHFDWSAIASPQTRGNPIPVTLTAKTVCEDTVTSFAGVLDLRGIVESTRSVGAGSSTWGFPLYTYYHDARTQVLYLQSELGGAATFGKLALYVTTIPGQAMANFTIRIKHTTASDQYSGAWEGPASGWTTVYQRNTSIPSTGWYWFDFSTAFDYNGVNNLLIDFSFNNSSYTTEGVVRTSTRGAYRTFWYCADSMYGDPLDWEGVSDPPAIWSDQVPDLQLGIENEVSISPSATDAFTSGVWTGTITVNETASQMLLRASDTEGHSTNSNLFDVVVPTYTLLMNADHGSVTLAPDLAEYPDGSTVVLTPSPDTGYHFDFWSGDVPTGHEGENPLTLTMNENKTLTANFAINQYTMAYAAGSGGSLDGATSQTVNHGDDGTTVTALPDTGHYFVNWSDDSTQNPRRDLNVTGDIDVAANFAIYTYTLTYNAGLNGSISGDSPQTVDYGGNGSMVTAVADPGYHFIEWNDGSTDNPRQDTNVAADINVTANFADITLPTSQLAPVADTTRVGTSLSLNFSATDDGSGVASTALWVKVPGAGSFVASGLTQSGTSGSFAYTVAAGDGMYAFATKATDNAANAEPDPTAADVHVIVNTVADSEFTWTLATADSVTTYPMTDTLDVLVAITGAAPGGTITVSRTAPLSFPTLRTGWDPENVLNEGLTITGTSLGTGWTATLTWPFDPASDDGMTKPINAVFQYEGGVLQQTYPVTPSGTTLVVPGITSFSDWYAGNMAATEVEDWTLMK